MEVTSWPVSRPIPYARNARKISQASIDKVAASIKEFGWRQPIVVDKEDVIIAGHTRLLAAHKLCMEQVPVHVANNLTPAQVKAYRLMDNRSNDEAEWDIDLLGPELMDLQGLDIDLSLTGFGDDELAKFLATADAFAGLTDEDAVPDAPDHPVTELGDLWILGRHRLLCGDSTVATDVDRLLHCVSPHLMVTDPPYGVEYNAEWRETALGGKRAVGKVTNDQEADWREAWALFPGNIAYVWHAGRRAAEVQVSLEACDFVIRCQIIWAKNQFAIGRGDYHWQHEPCWYAVKGSGNWQGDRSQTTLWQIDKPHKSETGHSTQKPIECMRRPIINNSSPGQAVYDPFCGSGTTIIACEKEGRSALTLEIEPKYCDVIINRWQDFTGKEATLDGDGRTFTDVAMDRKPVAA